MIVKPARDNGSIIEFGAVSSIAARRHGWLNAGFRQFKSEYGGRDVSRVLGNDKPEALPVVELDLSKLPDGTPRIAAAEVKWGKGTKAYRDTKSAIARVVVMLVGSVFVGLTAVRIAESVRTEAPAPRRAPIRQRQLTDH